MRPSTTTSVPEDAASSLSTPLLGEGDELTRARRAESHVDANSSWDDGGHHQPAVGRTSTPGSLGASTPATGAASPGCNGSQELKGLKGISKRMAAKPFLREPRPRRKLSWLLINQKGERQVVHADKRTLIQRFDLGVPMRDMRLLDCTLLTTEGGKMLVRDNAIVVSMEHVRVIITADFVLVPRDGGVEGHAPHARFVEKLEDAIIEADKEATLSRMSAPLDGGDIDGGGSHALEVLPFELVVLEVSLGEVCSSFAAATIDLEALAMPALDALLKRVSKSGLELVRKLKARQQRLLLRVSGVRDEFERFLDDDSDLQKFCLTRKKELEEMVKERHRSILMEGGASQHNLGSQAGPSMMVGSQGRRMGTYMGGLRSMLQAHTGSPPVPQQHQRAGADPLQHLLRHSASGSSGIGLQGGGGQYGTPGGQYATPGGGSGGGQFAGMYGGQEDADADAMEAVENLLESYYMYIDNAYDKLMSLDEYIKDTEEFIDIDLDWNRNRLIKLEIILTAATFAIAPFNLVAGILGENVVIPYFMAREDMDSRPFWVINFTAMVCCVLLFVAIHTYIRYLKLM